MPRNTSDRDGGSLTVALLHLGEKLSSKRRRRHCSKLPREQIKQVEARVGSVLAQLEALRKTTLREIDRRAAWMIPTGLVSGFVFGALYEKNPSLFGAIASALVGAMVGWVCAFTSPNRAYRRAFKESIVPHLASCFGELDYRTAVEPDLQRLSGLGLIPDFSRKTVEDEIYGRYRGVRTHIVEARLEQGAGRSRRVVFNGLLAELAFPGRFPGTTIVGKDGGLFGNAVRDFVKAAGLQRVRLEDARFESRYQVFGTDQIGARRLLTPAVMQRLMDLARHIGEPPGLLAENGTLRIALSKEESENLFEPPSIANPVGGSDVLIEIANDIGSVLEIIDAVLELDPTSTPIEAVH